MELWVCGKVRKVYTEKLVVWDLQGVFDSETQAVNACKTDQHFVGPVLLNEELPEEGVQWPGAYFPNKGIETTVKRAKDKTEAFNMQTIPPGSHGWIQWKGTDVCMDVHCICGKSSHVDGYFAYHVKCPYCGKIYFCNGHVEFIELEESPVGTTLTAVRDILDILDEEV